MPDPFGDSTCWERPTLFCPPIPMNIREDIINGTFEGFFGDPNTFWYGGKDNDGRLIEPGCCNTLNFPPPPGSH